MLSWGGRSRRMRAPGKDRHLRMTTEVAYNRRQFLSGAASTALAGAFPSSTHSAMAFAATARGLRGRFITHVSIVRVNQIEVTPTRSIGQDEVADNSIARIQSRRDAFARGCPQGRMTWAISWLALIDDGQQYKDARRLLASYHDKYGDEITFIPGGYFAPMYDTRENNRQTIHKALAMVSNIVGGGYRPQCLVAGFMDAENQRHLANEEGIHVCQGQIWSQHGIDNGDGDGGICYPYYPSREHYLKPAQGAADFIDCVCLDGWTLRLPPRPSPGLRRRIQQPPRRRSHRIRRQPRQRSRPQRDARHYCRAL
jgi:hypothetical protein